MKYLKKVFNDCMTGPDGITIDPSRVFWILGMVVFLAFAGHDLYKNGKFDMVNFGLAYGGLLAAGAAGIKIKETTEPAALTPKDKG